MSILKWAAVAVTALMGLMNLGLVLGEFSPALKATGFVLAVLAAVAICGLAAGAPWGRAAAIAIGAINVVGGVIAGFTGFEGWAVGLAVAALGLVLASVYRPSPHAVGA